MIRPEDWRPIGVEDLEANAWRALRDSGNTAVVAGPGAGKTEFLAQRASYLLQTGICPWPQRILAISFKRDAAANLARRVSDRVPEHADRFASMTFDAYTKGLVDRFASALPKDWQMANGYDVKFPSKRDVGSFLDYIIATAPTPFRPQATRFRADAFLPDTVGGWNLPINLSSDGPDDATAYAVLQWWQRRYLRPGPAEVDFVMLNRLAELLVRSAPKLRRALRQTYPFVFVDEFQDTTSAQFSLLASVFTDGPTVTAVGDSKQNIMGWAGAISQALERFTAAFGATRYDLELNFRSSPKLTRMQHVIATRLDPRARPAVSRVAATSDDNPAELWQFSSPAREATVIAHRIAQDIATSGRVPANFALLARQKVGDYESRFSQALARYGIKVRNDDQLVGEMRLQDLLKHEIARLLLGLLQLGDQPRGLHQVWREVQSTLARIHSAAGDDVALRRVGDDLSILTRALRSWMRANPPHTIAAGDCVAHLLGLVDAEALHRYMKSATPGDQLDLITEAFRVRLAAVTPADASWTNALERFECADAVALLTAHRSKGLEYHTVFFLGLDDEQWWAYDRDPVESTSTFFVGLSRAAQRIIFTTTSPNARRGRIADFFTMLDEAGVPEINQG
ncbi:ATP-dependent helicase [Actinoplanes sp. NPDC026670]|uniref:ATP-dependent helicase n=1 Tax=Actinoplanes sp. NPDC026670 TaxID=3154700 RepID=UPI0033CC4F58